MLANRRGLLLFGGLFAVAGFGLVPAGCNQAGQGNSAGNADDIVVGAANAPVTLVEYYSVTCPFCKQFHDEAWARLKANYIDTGKVRMIFREVPTGDPPAHAIAGFQLARCGNASTDQYLARVDALFGQFDAMTTTGESARQKLIEIGSASNLSEQQVMACVNDGSGIQRAMRNSDLATRKFGPRWGTPLLELEGRRLEAGSDYTYDGLSRTLDAAIAAHH